MPKVLTGEVIIQKLKLKDKEIHITYELPSPNSDQKIVNFKSEEEPSTRFHPAIDNLLDDVCAICGLDADAWMNGKVTGITFKHNDDGDYDVVITAQCVVNNLLNVVVNTPLFHPKETLEVKLDNVLAELEEYLKGKRKNQQLSIL